MKFIRQAHLVLDVAVLPGSNEETVLIKIPRPHESLLTLPCEDVRTLAEAQQSFLIFLFHLRSYQPTEPT